MIVANIVQKLKANGIVDVYLISYKLILILYYFVLVINLLKSDYF